jgi:hypothetical protein
MANDVHGTPYTTGEDVGRFITKTAEDGMNFEAFFQEESDRWQSLVWIELEEENEEDCEEEKEN